MRLSLVLSCLFFFIACGKNDKKHPQAIQDTIPNVCQTVSIIGSFPDTEESADKSYVYACFEGFVQIDNQKVYLSEAKCREGLANANKNSEEAKLFKPLASTTCPMAGSTATCENETSKIVAYREESSSFNPEKFKMFCESQGGRITFY